MDTCFTQAKVILIYHVHSLVSVTNVPENILESILCIPCKLKCHLTTSKGQFCFEQVMPYQSTVVFAVLVGQLSNGGCDAGTEELLSLVQVALVDFI